MTIGIESISPSTATKMLSTSLYNRTLKESQIRKIVSSINSGNWHVEVTDVQIDTNGHLMGGHHLLSAIERSGITLNCIVKRGIDPEVRKFTNECHASTPNDSWILSGHAPIVNATRVWGAQKFIYDVLFYNERDPYKNSMYLTNSERVNDMEQKVSDLEEYARISTKIVQLIVGYTKVNSIKLGALAGISGAMYILRGEKMNEIIDNLKSGTIVAGSCIEHFRNFIRNTTKCNYPFVRGIGMIRLYYDIINNNERRQAYDLNKLGKEDNLKKMCEFASQFIPR